MYVGLENDDQVVAIDTLLNKVITTIPIGQGAQAVIYVPNAVPDGTARAAGLQPLGIAGQATHLIPAPPTHEPTKGTKPPTSVTLFDQGLVQVLEAAVTGLEAKQSYVLALASHTDRSGDLEPLSSFMTNTADSQIINAVGPIRPIVPGGTDTPRRYLVIVQGSAAKLGKPVQVQAD